MLQTLIKIPDFSEVKKNQPIKYIFDKFCKKLKRPTCYTELAQKLQIYKRNINVKNILKLNAS